MRKIISVIIATVLLISMAFPYSASAETYINSIGSEESDIQHKGNGSPIHPGGSVAEKSDGVVGYDETQGKETEYVDYSESENQHSLSVDVYSSIPEEYVQVSYPTVLIIDGEADSNGDYVAKGTVKVKGYLRRKTVVNIEPQDEDDESSGINFFIYQRGKHSLTATVTQPYTAFAASDSTVAGSGIKKSITDEFNDDASSLITVKVKNATAGNWHGEYNTVISLDYE